MKKLIVPGRVIFATGIIALAILQFVMKDYIIGRPPLPKWASSIPGKIEWAYISSVLLIAASLAVIVKKKGAAASFFIGVLILIFSFLVRHLTDMFGDTFQGIIWRINAYKTLALAGGAFIVGVSFLKEKNHDYNYRSPGGRLVFTGCIFLALFMIMSGCAHIKFYDFVVNFIPAYIPAHSFWTYFTATALIAGGIGLLFKRTRKLAALLSGAMILLWFILLHIPRTVAAPKDYGEWMGVFESFAFSGILFVLAGLCAKSE